MEIIEIIFYIILILYGAMEFLLLTFGAPPLMLTAHLLGLLNIHYLRSKALCTLLSPWKEMHDWNFFSKKHKGVSNDRDIWIIDIEHRKCKICGKEQVHIDNYQGWVTYSSKKKKKNENT